MPEIVSIVIAILLAFALNAWNDQRKVDEAVRQSLSDVRREVAARTSEGRPLALDDALLNRLPSL